MGDGATADSDDDVTFKYTLTARRTLCFSPRTRVPPRTRLEERIGGQLRYPTRGEVHARFREQPPKLRPRRALAAQLRLEVIVPSTTPAGVRASSLRALARDTTM